MTPSPRATPATRRPTPSWAGRWRTYDARLGWEVDPAEVSLLPDVMAGMSEILRGRCPRGAGWSSTLRSIRPSSAISEAGCRVVEAPLARAGAGWGLDLDALEAAFTTGTAVYLLCNPHNPSGLVLTAEELRHVAELAERFSGDGARRRDPCAAHPRRRPSRPLSLAARGAGSRRRLGLRQQGVEPSRAQVRSAGHRRPGDAGAGRTAAVELSFGAGHLGVIASIAAYRDGGPWLDELLVLLDHNRRLLADLLAERLPEVGYVPPQGTYLAWLDCTRLGLSTDPATLFLQRGRVALRRGPDFGSPGAGWARATIATHPDILGEIVDRMRTALG